jgi:hypothetical protein
VTPAQNTVGLQYRTADANYPNPQAVGTTLVENDYIENEYSLVAHWQPNGISDIVARLGHTERKFEQAPDRNYSAPTWRLTYNWKLTGKTALEFSTWRELAEFQDLTANYVRVTGISVSPIWSITPQVALRGKVSRDNLDYLGNATASANNREDKDRLYQISALWTPLRLTELDFSIETGRRTSNQLNADYKYTATSILFTRYF